jgi:hypothetical protein
VTDRQEAALLALMGDLCSSGDAAAFAERWGRPEPSRRRPRGLRVACDAAAPFAALELRPWTEEVTGVVDVEWREDEPPLAWPAVRGRFGPFEALPTLHTGEEHAASWSVPGAAAAAYLVVGVAGDTVASVMVRRDPL